MLSLIVNNLMRRRARTLLTALGVGVGVAMIVALLALTQGLQSSAAGLIHLGGSDLGIFQSGVSDPTASMLPEALVQRLEHNPLVARATPIALVVEAIHGQPAAVTFGVRPGSFFMRNLVFLTGSPPAAGQVALGEALARTLHAHAGSQVRLKGTTVTVSGVYHTGILYEDAGAVIPLAAAQALLGRSGEATLIAVQLAAGTSAQRAQANLERTLPGTEVISTPEQAARAGANGVLISNAVDVIIVVALIVGGISVTNTMVMATIERQGELAVLATVGWSARQVGGLIIGEGIAVSLLGAAIGLLVGVLGSLGLVAGLGVSSYVSPVITAWGLGRGLLIGIAIGVLGGIYPAWRATRMPPLKGLARA